MSQSKSIQLLCSTGVFSRYPDLTGYQAIVKYGPLLEVDGFEVMFYPNWYSQTEHIADKLLATGLRFPAMHTEKNIGTALGQTDPTARKAGIRMLAENCQLANLLGTKLLVLHLWNWPELDDNLDNNLSTLHECYDIALQHGIELALESIPARHFDPLTNLQRALTSEARSHFALDTEFLANYKQLDSVFQQPWLWEADRTHHVHIKDSVGQSFVDGQRRYLHPGEGNIDFKRFFSQLQHIGFAGNVSLESPAITINGEIDIEQLHSSLNFIRKQIEHNSVLSGTSELIPEGCSKSFEMP
jgi:sugar phosphate isomerase/epimerase